MSPVQVVHKPLPLELFLTSVRWAADAAFWWWGYRGTWLPTSEGWIRFWLAMPKTSNPAMLPAVFIHGVGFGAGPYLPFLEKLRRGRDAPLLVMELPNSSRCSYQAAMPSAQSFRDALERALGQLLGISEPGRYVLLGHSLGTDFCTMVMNDPRIAHADPPIRPARLVLLDPVCFPNEIADAHRLPFWTIREALDQKDMTWWKVPLQLTMLFTIIRDEYNQEATKRTVGPGTDVMFRCSPELLRRCPTLVCLSGEDKALPAWKVHDYIRAQVPDINVRMHPTFEHGGFLTSAGWLARTHADDVLDFLKVKGGPDLKRVGSVPGTEDPDSPMRRALSLPCRQKSCSNLLDPSQHY